MRYLLFFMASFICTAKTMAQNDAMDTLKKFSYYVFGKQPSADDKSMLTVEGTCFFVEANKKILLVSAKHLITGWGTSDASPITPYPDTLYIRIPGNAKIKSFDYALDIRVIKSNITGDFYYNEPDIFVMEFPAPQLISNDTVTDIQLLHPSADTGNISIVYGYPHSAVVGLDASVYSSPGQNLQYHDHKRNTDIIDKINYLIKCHSEVKGGYSGAPVFLKNETTGAWNFGGIVSQGVPGDNYFFVVKPRFLVSQILGEFTD